MKNERGRTLAPGAARDVLARTPHRVDDEMSRELMRTVYVLADGAALVLEESGRGRLWYSHERMVSEYKATLKLALERHDVLRVLLPQARGFVLQVPALIVELPGLLDIDTVVMDFSEASLAAVDLAIRRLGSERILTPEIFPSLLAYVGEVIRRQVNGSWEVRTTRDGTRHEPDIVDSTGGRYGLLRMYKQLLEYGRTASMRTFVHAALTTHRLRPPN